MRDKLLRIYHHLPMPLRAVAASMRGFYLRSWRYGPETERLVEEAIDRERWSPERWRSWQEERLAYVLHRAATRVPYYREQWTARRRRGDGASWEHLENWPVLDKSVLRAQPAAFVADDRDRRTMFHVHTSGTTGTPLDLWWSRQTVRAWYALYEARVRRWNGVSRHDHWAILGGQPIISGASDRPPFWVWNAPMRQLYLSANHVSRASAPACIAALERYRVTHLIAYASSAAILAREALRSGSRAAGLRVVITNAEPLLPWQRETIRDGLGVDVRATYGMAEIVDGASECSAEMLHRWPEAGWIEVLSDAADVPAAAGTAGRLVATGLFNADMPLVRYAVGDRGRAAVETPPCACGRGLPPASEIEGRTNDLLRTRDGRYVYWLNPVFYGLAVSEAQIVQDALDRVRVRYVPAAGSTRDTERTIVERLQTRMGHGLEVILEPVTEISRGANGKFQAVVCNLPEAR